MKASDYHKIESHPLRDVLRAMVTDRRDLPSRSELREAIEAAVPSGTDQKTKETLFDYAIKLAEKAAAKGRDSWWDLRGEADRHALSLVQGWEAADRILPLGEEEEIDVGGIADTVMAQRHLWGD